MYEQRHGSELSPEDRLADLASAHVFQRGEEYGSPDAAQLTPEQIGLARNLPLTPGLGRLEDTLPEYGDGEYVVITEVETEGGERQPLAVFGFRTQDGERARLFSFLESDKLGAFTAQIAADPSAIGKMYDSFVQAKDPRHGYARDTASSLILVEAGPTALEAGGLLTAAPEDEAPMHLTTLVGDAMTGKIGNYTLYPNPLSSKDHSWRASGGDAVGVYNTNGEVLARVYKAQSIEVPKPPISVPLANVVETLVPAPEVSHTPEEQRVIALAEKYAAMIDPEGVTYFGKITGRANGHYTLTELAGFLENKSPHTTLDAYLQSAIKHDDGRQRGNRVKFSSQLFHQEKAGTNEVIDAHLPPVLNFEQRQYDYVTIEPRHTGDGSMFEVDLGFTSKQSSDERPNRPVIGFQLPIEHYPDFLNDLQKHPDLATEILQHRLGDRRAVMDTITEVYRKCGERLVVKEQKGIIITASDGRRADPHNLYLGNGFTLFSDENDFDIAKQGYESGDPAIPDLGVIVNKLLRGGAQDYILEVLPGVETPGLPVKKYYTVPGGSQPGRSAVRLVDRRNGSGRPLQSTLFQAFAPASYQWTHDAASLKLGPALPT